MISALISLGAFVVAIGTLVTFHELGHYWVAKRLGVKVLRFSVGFGKPLWRTVAGADRTEYVLAAIPLGGYVKMLDEREGPVAESEAARAFNRQPVGRRIAIVAAGPGFNFLLAIVAYSLTFMLGVSGMKPLVGEIAPESPAAQAGLEPGDEIVAVGGEATPIWQIASLSLIDQALDKGDVALEIRGPQGGLSEHTLALDDTRALLGEDNPLTAIGITPQRPKLDAVLGELIAGGPAARSGLQPGDRIVSVAGTSMDNWNDWVNFVRAHPEERLELEIERAGSTREVTLTTGSQAQGGERIGRIGAYPQVDQAALDAMRQQVRYGPLASLGRGFAKTWDMSALTVRVLGRLVTGGASWKNVSGPITIAEFAGMSAVIGLSAFLGALALFSISIGILNLLPVPILDGGHLLYYAIELVKGSPVSAATEALGQRVGLAMLAGLMALAFYNDFTRLLG